MKKKLIGITPRIIVEGTVSKQFVNDTYMNAMSSLGFIPLMLPLDNNDIEFLIEYDGEGHFKKVNQFYKTNKNFDNARGRDRLKNNYCLAKRIPLYRIPYWEIDNIHTMKDIVQKKFLVISQYHNERLTPK